MQKILPWIFSLFTYVILSLFLNKKKCNNRSGCFGTKNPISKVDFLYVLFFKKRYLFSRPSALRPNKDIDGYIFCIDVTHMLTLFPFRMKHVTLSIFWNRYFIFQKNNG